MENLSGLKVAILVENGFEQVELTEPRKALDQAGAETRIVSPQLEHVRGWKFTDWGDMCYLRMSLLKEQTPTTTTRCQGPWTVIEAGAARGRRIASWPS